MILRKYSLLTPTYTLLQHNITPHQPSTSCRHQQHHGHPAISPQQKRQYAAVVDDRSHSSFPDDPEHTWPEAQAPNQTPTPYQILQHRKGEQYSKSYFYKLAKLYHPDRTAHDHLCPAQLRELPHAVRLERYRLITDAHAILSDDVKRKAYDRYGVGWAGGPTADVWGVGKKSMSRERSKWPPGRDPMNNANWEDWEKWYRWRDNPKGAQQPLYLSNTAFFSLVMAALFTSTIVQYDRAKSAPKSEFVLAAERNHRAVSKSLRQAKEASRNTATRQDQIEAFLRFNDLDAHNEEVYRRWLPRKDVCESDPQLPEPQKSRLLPPSGERRLLPPPPGRSP